MYGVGPPWNPTILAINVEKVNIIHFITERSNKIMSINT